MAVPPAGRLVWFGLVNMASIKERAAALNLAEKLRTRPGEIKKDGVPGVSR